MKKIIQFLALCTLLVFASGVSALMISVDPGSVGGSFKDRTIPFNDLDGTSFNNQNLLLDIIFTEMKQLELAFNDNTTTDYFFTAQLVLMHSGGFLGLPPSPTGFLTDKNGNNIANAGPINPFQGNGLTGYNLQFTEIVDGLLFHDIHFDLTLPNAPAFVVAEAELNLKITSPNGDIKVVSEPTTFALMGLGLAGMGYARRRNNKAA